MTPQRSDGYLKVAVLEIYGISWVVCFVVIYITRKYALTWDSSGDLHL